MKIEKLELKHLCHYLPYGLKAEDDEGNIGKLCTLSESGYVEIEYDLNIGQYEFYITCIKPILRPLSDFNLSDAYKEINETYTLEYCNDLLNDAMVDGFEAKWLPYEAMEVMFKHHFDVFNLIPSGLAIDINTIDINTIDL